LVNLKLTSAGLILSGRGQRERVPAGEIGRRLAEKLPVAAHVFIDPTQTAPAGRQ
jgi:hypothetical protein